MHARSNLLRSSIPRIWMISPPILHDSQVVLSQLPDIAIQDSPTSCNVPVKFFGFEFDVVKIITHLMKSVREALSFHESQGASGHGTQSSKNCNADVRVDAGQTAKNDEDGTEQELQDQQHVREHIENAVLCVDVLVLGDDPRVHTVLHGERL